METQNKHRLLFTLSACFLMFFAVAQTGYSGDALLTYIGKDVESADIKSLITNYNCETGNPSRCISKNGIELTFKKNILTEIRLYKGSVVYGDYKGTLPYNLRFGMTAADVKALFGKPVVSYNSGYSEFSVKGYDIACWFDAGRLSQVNISASTANL